MPVSIFITWNGESCHEKLKFRSRCSGDERLVLGEEIMRDGVGQVQQENEIYNFLKVDSNGIIIICFIL
jgi:hypothetical protein